MKEVRVAAVGDHVIGDGRAHDPTTSKTEAAERFGGELRGAPFLPRGVVVEVMMLTHRGEPSR
jgi:hypothetical protein